MEKVTKKFAGNYRNLAKISDFIIEITTNEGFSGKDVYAIQTAVDEACANIIDHAYQGENIGDIIITLVTFPKYIKIIIEDSGTPFDPDSVPAPDITSPLEIRKERGLGVFFIRKLMDEAIFDFSSPKGNTLTLIKNKRS